MCCDPQGECGEPTGVCSSCGEDTIDGLAKEICGYSSVICEDCGRAPCDGSC